MWVFYLISLPLTLGMVTVTLRYFAGPDVPRYVLFTVGYAWFCSLSIIILVPADIWTAELGGLQTLLGDRAETQALTDVIRERLRSLQLEAVTLDERLEGLRKDIILRVARITDLKKSVG